jgi:hypothetical protein
LRESYFVTREESSSFLCPLCNIIVFNSGVWRPRCRPLLAQSGWLLRDWTLPRRLRAAATVRQLHLPVNLPVIGLLMNLRLLRQTPNLRLFHLTANLPLLRLPTNLVPSRLPRVAREFRLPVNLRFENHSGEVYLRKR